MKLSTLAPTNPAKLLLFFLMLNVDAKHRRAFQGVSGFVYEYTAPRIWCLLTCVYQTSDMLLVMRRHTIVCVLQGISKDTNI